MSTTPAWAVTPALDSSGALKDTSDMEWDHDKDDGSAEHSLGVAAIVTVPVSPTPHAAPLPSVFKNFVPGNSGFVDFADNSSKRKHSEQTTTATGRNTNRSKAKASNAKAAAKSTAQRESAMDRILGIPVAIPRTSSAASLSSHASAAAGTVDIGDTDEEEQDNSRAGKRSRGNGAADILAVFKYTDPDDQKKGLDCVVCL